MIIFLMNKIDLSIRNEPDIIILKSMISVYKMNNNFEALYYISQIKNSEMLDTQGELLMHRIKLKTQKDISDNATMFETDINYMVYSYNTFNKFVEKILTLSKNTNMFWKEMAIKRPNFKRLNRLGFWVAEASEALKRDYQQQEVAASYRTKMTLIYIGFLYRVLNKNQQMGEIKKLLFKIGVDTHDSDAAFTNTIVTPNK